MKQLEQFNPLFVWLNEFFAPRNITPYIVGGFIRDVLLESIVDADIDIVTEVPVTLYGEACAQALGGKITFFSQFGTAKISEIHAGKIVNELDFAEARSEIYQKPGALPQVTPAQLENDLERRDFSINAIAGAVREFISIDTKQAFLDALIDPQNGVDDLEKKIIRVLHDRSFIDDPTRIFRAFRYEQRIKGTLDPHTEKLLTAAMQSNVLTTVSYFRVFSEYRKIFKEKEPLAILHRLNAFNVMHQTFEAFHIDVKDLISNLEQVRFIPHTAYEKFLEVVFSLLKNEKKLELARALNIPKSKIPK